SVSCAVRTTPARAGPGRARGERARAFAGPQAAYGRSWKLRPPAYQEAYRPRYLRISGVPARRRPLRSDVSLPDRAALPDDAPPPKASHPALASGRDAVPDTASRRRLAARWRHRRASVRSASPRGTGRPRLRAVRTLSPAPIGPPPSAEASTDARPIDAVPPDALARSVSNFGRNSSTVHHGTARPPEAATPFSRWNRGRSAHLPALP